VHTEYRYVLAVDYFLFALVGVTVTFGLRFIVRKLIRVRSQYHPRKRDKETSLSRLK